MIYPKTEIKVADVIAAKGALPLGCAVSNGKIIPTFSPGEVHTTKFPTVDMAVGSVGLNFYEIRSEREVFHSVNGFEFISAGKFDCTDPYAFEELEGEAFRLSVAGDKGHLHFYSNKSIYKSGNYGICGGQLKNGRFFGIDRENRYKLRWSGEGGGLDWVEGISGAGWVILDSKGGKILNIVTLGEKLIAVREQCLTVVSAFGTPEIFKIQATDTEVPNIVKNTAAVLCGKLFFFADGAIRCFDGNKILPLEHGLEDEIINPEFAITYGDGYHLCCTSKTLERQVVLVYDAKFNSSYIIDVPAVKLIGLNGIFAYYPNSACKLEEDGEFEYISGAIDFGTAGRKHLNRIEIACENSVDVEISNGRTQQKFEGVKGGFSADMCGAIFKITVKGRGEIKDVKAYAEVTCGV